MIFFSPFDGFPLLNYWSTKRSIDDGADDDDDNDPDDDDEEDDANDDANDDDEDDNKESVFRIEQLPSSLLCLALWVLAPPQRLLRRLATTWEKWKNSFQFL